MAWSLLSSYLELLLSLTSFISFFIYFKLTKNSTGPTNWPVVGMLPGLLKNINRLHEWSTTVLGANGCSYQFHVPWILGMDYLATCDPANVNHVFNVNFTNYPKGDEFLEIFDILGDGIFNADDNSWKSQRKMAHGIMSRANFRLFVAKCSREKVENALMPLMSRVAEGGTVVDLQDVFMRFTFDLTSDLIFGVDPKGLSIDFPTIPFSRAMDDVMEALLWRHPVPNSWWKLMRWLRLGKERRLAAARLVIDNFVAENIARKREEKLNPHYYHKGDLLASYMEVSEGGECDDKFLRDTAVNLMLAGRDTTGVALTWFFWVLSKNPRVKAKIVEELKNNVTVKEGISPVVFDPQELAKLVYLHASICESLRLFPPVPFEHKGALRPEILPSGHEVRAGTKVLFSTYSMGRIEGVWGKDCLEFMPERWISEKGRLKYEPSYKFLSFNCGPRTCLGKDIAFTQMKTAVAAMVYNFDIEVVENHAVEPKVSVILLMKNGLKMRVKQRRESMA